MKNYVISVTTLIIIIAQLLSFNLLAQSIDYNKVILPEGLGSLDFKEKLVQLAWKNHPDNIAVRREKDITMAEAKLVNRSWLNQVRAAGNLNEFTIDPDPEQNVFFPRYNFSILIPLGIFSEISLNKKIGEQRVVIANESINSKKIEVRTEVLKAYENYILNRELFTIRSNVLEDESTGFLTTERKFKDGEVDIEEYREASKNYNIEQEKKLVAKRNLEIAELELEALIGIPLEEVK